MRISTTVYLRSCLLQFFLLKDELGLDGADRVKQSQVVYDTGHSLMEWFYIHCHHWSEAMQHITKV